MQKKKEEEEKKEECFVLEVQEEAQEARFGL